MYRVLVRPQFERKQLAANARAASTATHPFHEYQGTKTDLPIIRLEIGTPIYRMANFRTRTFQLRHIHDHGKPADYFLAGEENESAQQAQHDILVEFAKRGRAESISPIYDELEKEEQKEPLIVTSGCVVVNGNRRLAAMRELFTQSPNEHRSFSHVDCALLPVSATLDEILEIEVRLQMRPETKLPYGWVDECLAIRDLMQSGRTSAAIADLMKKRRKDIERLNIALLEADIYLKDWLRAPGEYQHVEDAEQFFGDLASAVGAKEGEILEASRRVAWMLISNSKNLNRRVYEYNFSFGKNAEEVLSSLAERLDIDLSTKPTEEGSDLEIDLGNGADGSSYEALLDAFDDPERRQEIQDELVVVCDSILEKNRQGEVGRRALASVQSANTRLQEVDISKADTGTLPAIAAQLDTILQRATSLKAAVDASIRQR